MIALRKVQSIGRRFLNSAVSTNIKFDKKSSPLKENTFPQLDLLTFEPLLANEEIRANVTNIIEEYQKAQTSGKHVPSQLSLDIMEELLKLESRSQRYKYMTYRFKKDMIKLNAANKKKKLQEEKQNKMAPEPQRNHTQYYIGGNSIFIRILRRSMHKLNCLRNANAQLFGQNIVVDLDYEKYMMRKEARNSASQLVLLLGANRINRYPYKLHFCNAKSTSFPVECLKEQYPTLYEAEGFVNCTELSYLDLFPKEKLVYLSPHSSETLTHYDPTAVYIIGAFVDVSKKNKVSNVKAEKEGIKTYALPLDQYIMWSSGTKSLSINQVFEIMLEMKNTNDWRKAFKFIPTRKIKRLDTEELLTRELPDKKFLIDHSNKA